MTDQRPYMPTTAEVGDVWEHHSDWSISHFEAWLDQIRTEAKVEALRDAAKDLEWLGAQGNIPHPDTSWQGVLACKKALQAKADQIEGDE